MTTLYWVEVVVYGITAVMAGSLALTVVGAGPRQRINRSFALFMLAEAVSAMPRLFLRLDRGLGLGVPLPLAELVFLTIPLRGPLLTLFVTSYIGRRTRRTDLFVGLGLAMVVICCFPLFGGQLIAPGPEVDGIASGSNVWMLVMAGIPLPYLIWSLVLFWQERRRVIEPFLVLGVLVLLIGPFSTITLGVPFWSVSIITALSIAAIGYLVVSRQIFNPLWELTEELERRVYERTMELEAAYAEIEKRVEEQTAELQRETAERERLQQEIIEAQRQAIAELSTPVIPITDRIIVMPLVGNIDTIRARDITRAILAGIREHEAQVVIVDITGVAIVDSGVANHLNKTIQAARLKGAYTIVTGISNAVAETIVDLGIDWSGIETLTNLQTGLRAALTKMGQRIEG